MKHRAWKFTLGVERLELWNFSVETLTSEPSDNVFVDRSRPFQSDPGGLIPLSAATRDSGNSLGGKES